VTPPDPLPNAHIVDRGETVGRFVLIGLLGRGGMGEVYAAYDPELDRKVAVKILRGGRSSDGEARLLREAQAIAKLQHPNVVVVYDVGHFRDTVFIAMEFIDGHTLGYWMNAEPRPWRETLRIFQAAGRGLEAAHDLGMVHRDFKPDNVMLTKDGQVRVMDFGLARQVGETEPAEGRTVDAAGSKASAPAPQAPSDVDPDSTMPVGSSSKPISMQSSGRYLELKLTQTGVQIGTPAYMAPEQFSGHRSDARSDQFSFCVALYEALYGERPFAGDTMLALTTSVLAGEVRPAPEKARVPGWIRRILLRGLATDPAARYASMKALRTALEQDPSVGRRRWLAAAGAIVGVAAIGVAASRAGEGKRTMCAGGAAKLAGVWEPGGARSPRKEAISEAFARSGKSFAVQTFAAASRALDEYAGRWTAMYRDACEATNVRGEQSAEVLDLRMSCLGTRLENIRALTDVFTKADGEVVTNAVSAVGALPPLDGCADVAALRAVIKPSSDPAVRKRVDELRGELARVTAIRDAGGCAEAEKRGAKLIEDIRPTKDRDLLAQALNVVGFLGNFCADPQVSLARVEESYAEAVVAHDDALAAYSASIAIIYLADRLGKIEGAHDWHLVARAEVDRLGDSQRAFIIGSFLSAEGVMRGAEHDAEGWVAGVRAGTVATAKAYGAEHYLALTGLANTANALEAVGRDEESIAENEKVLAIAERVLGPDHTLVAGVCNNECEALNRVGRYADALRLCRRALGIWHEQGADAVIRSYTLTQEGLALVGVGKSGEALPPLEEALKARVDAHVNPAQQGETRFALARALWAKPATHPRALALARQARADYGADAKAVAEIDAWLSKPK
jgi:tetratricopeptide (TPR) repeat protein/predicted Ser/Thr protein kinase